ncbi:peptidoglycan-binding protein [Streptomyces sp. NPDC059011]|uniref:peptidoglycan-binding protein n=1 Tax=unclassified Streptomyces TaxID=2593676 RepID=UPI0036A499C3
MTVPVFEEYEPAGDCVCPGCAQQRRERARALPVRAGGHPAAHGARRALVLVTAAGAVLSGGNAGALADPGAGRPPVPEPEAAAPRTARSGAPAVAAQAAAPPRRPVGERAARAHTARAGRAGPGRDRPERDPAPAPAPVERAGTDSAPVGPGGTDRPRADRVRAVGPAGSGRDPRPDPETPQGGQEPLHGGPIAGPAGTAGLRKMARADIMNRAKRWVNAKVPYSMSRYWADGYRQDCSGYVSMAWHLPGNEWTGSLAQFGTRIERKDLQPGDILLFHNLSNPSKGSHVTIFGGWADSARTKYIAYEQARPNTRRQTTPLAYWSNSDQYVAYRYKAVKGVGTAGGTIAGIEGLGEIGEIGFPGVGVFAPGEDNAHVARLARLLAEQGFGSDDTAGPGSRWGEAHRRATQAFQHAQGWRGREADGVPGPDTWRLLVNGTGRKAAAGADAAAPNGPGLQVGSVAGAPAPAAGPTATGPEQVPSSAARAPAGSGATAAGSVSAGARQAVPAPTPVTGTPSGGRAAAAPARPASTVRSVPAAPRRQPPAAAAPRRPGAATAAPAGSRRQASGAAASAPGFPGHGHFRPGSSGRHLDTLRRQLVKRGFARHYSTRPGPRWGDADRRSVEAFQRAQGWHGAAADGYPGPETWRRLFS